MTPKLWEIVDLVSAMSHKARMAFDKQKDVTGGRDIVSEDQGALAAAKARQAAMMGR